MVVTFGGADKTTHVPHDGECGFRCKLGKSFMGVKSSIKKAQDDARRKKADRYGVSLEDYDKGVEEAKKKGKKKAYDSFLRDIEQSQYSTGSKTKKTKSAMSTLDSILGGLAEKPRKRKTTRRKTPKKSGSYVIVGGKAYRKATNKTKRKKRTRLDMSHGSPGRKIRSDDNFFGNMDFRF